MYTRSVTCEHRQTHTYCMPTCRGLACSSRADFICSVRNNTCKHKACLHLDYSTLIVSVLYSQYKTLLDCYSQAFMTISPLISGFQSSHDVSKPSAKRIQKFLKCPLLTKESDEQAVISVLSIVSTKAEPVSKSKL